MAAYPEVGNAAPGTEFFHAMRRQYRQNIRVHSIAGLEAHETGATYLIEDKNSEQYFFSLHAYQAAQAEAGEKTWSMTFGNTKEPALTEHMETNQAFLRKHGLSLEVLLDQNKALLHAQHHTAALAV